MTAATNNSDVADNSDATNNSNVSGNKAASGSRVANGNKTASGSLVDNGRSVRPVDRQGRKSRREPPARPDWIDRDDRRDPPARRGPQDDSARDDRRDPPVQGRTGPHDAGKPDVPNGRRDQGARLAAIRSARDVRGAVRPWRFVLVVEPASVPGMKAVPVSGPAASLASETAAAPEMGAVTGSGSGVVASSGSGSGVVASSGSGLVSRPVERVTGSRSPYEVTLRAALLLGPGVMALREPYEPTLKLRFDRAAPSRLAAILAAVRDTERCGLRVLRVDNDDWVTAADIAQRAGWSRETVRLWAAGKVGPGGFPQPANPRRDTTFYSWAEVLPWLRERRGLDLPDDEPALVAANLAVQLRALLPRLSHPDLLLTLLRPVPEP